MAGKLVVVVGGQFGSEGKGAIAAKLAERVEAPLMAMRVAGSNAGHTVVAANGEHWPLRQIPVAAVANPDAQLAIAAGSEIDLDVLLEEIDKLDKAGFEVSRRLLIDSQATLVTSAHYADEAMARLTQRIGSTGKGIGAARAARLMRQAKIWGVRRRTEQGDLQGCDTAQEAMDFLAEDGEVHIEGTQGYGLGLHAGYYPYCTSSDCRWIDFVAMAGTPPNLPDVELEVWVVLRTMPIRVAGNSGPLFCETTWDELARDSNGYIQPEHTTVTHRVRRIGQWNPKLASGAIQANGQDVKVALTFFDYWYPELAGATGVQALSERHLYRMVEVEKQIRASISYVGTGPNTGIWL